MTFKVLMFGLTAMAVGAVVFSSTSGDVADGKDFSTGVANAPAEGETAKPSLGNFASALGIVFGDNGGQMRSASGPSDSRLVTDPAKTRRAEFYGWRVEHPGLIGPGDSLHLVQSALQGVPMRQEAEFPAEVVAQAPESACTAPPRGPGESLAKVQVFMGAQPSGYHAVDDAALTAGAYGYVRKLQRATDPESETPPGDSPAVPVVNVVLTDDSASLYLVLQAASNPVLFNLHAGAGVDVARIVVVGNPGTAVSPANPETPIAFLDIAEGCAPQPWREARPWWDMYQTPGGAGGNYEADSVERHLAYEAWFAATFGEASEPGTVGGWEVNHVLVGPLPASAEARVAYRPLTGARIVAHAGPLLYVSPPREREADIAGRRRALVTAAAGGDLSILNPTPMERTQ